MKSHHTSSQQANTAAHGASGPRQSWLAVFGCCVMLAGCASPREVSADRSALAFPVAPTPAPIATSEGLVDVGGARIRYADTATAGPALVLMHPATGNSASWAHQLAPLSKAGYRVIVYSRRGHWGSDVGSADQRGTAAGDLGRLLDHLRIAQAHIVGVAAGGIYATDFALSQPQRVRSLTIASSIVAIGDPAYMKTANDLRPKGFTEMPAEFRELSPSYRATNPEGVRQWLDVQGRNEISPDTSPASRQPPQNRLTLDALGRLTMPVLFMTGAADLYTPPVLLARMVSAVPHAKAVVIAGAGHSPHWERPDLFNDVLLSFLATAAAQAPRP